MDNPTKFKPLPNNGDAFAALAEIVWQNIPSDPDNVKTIKEQMLKKYRAEEKLCSCGQQHMYWICALIDIYKMVVAEVNDAQAQTIH